MNVDSDYKRQLDGIRWVQGSNAVYNSSKTQLSFSNSFNTRFFLLDKQAQNIQDESILNLNVNQHLGSHFSLMFLANSYSFSATDVRQDQAYAGISMKDLNNFSGELLLGYMSDQRSGRTDQGFSTRSAVYYDFSDSESGFLSGIQPKLIFDWAELNPRRQYSGKINAPFSYSDQNLDVEGFLETGKFRRDSYQAGNFLNRTAGEFRESIITDSTQFGLVSNFPVLDTWRGRIELDGLSQIRRFESERLDPTNDEILYDSRFSTLRNSMRFTLNIPIRSHQIQPFIAFAATRDLNTLINTADIPSALLARRSEIIENSNFNQSFLQTGGNYGFQRNAFRVRLMANVGILRYNTPDINVDDRDEQSINFTFRWEYDRSEFLSFGSELSGERRQSVYLFSQRSSENNNRYSIRFRPFVVWRPNPRVQLRQSFSLRSNYTVFDFQLENQSTFDQSAREFGSQSMLEIRTGARWMHSVELNLTQLHIGRLDWNNFSETPLDTLTTIEAHVQTGKLFRRGKAFIGFRTFVKKDYSPLSQVSVEGNELISDRRFRGPGNLYTFQFGPTADVEFPFVFGHELIVRGWYQIQRSRQQLWATIPEEYSSLYRRASSDFPRRSFPNLEILARFRF